MKSLFFASTRARLASAARFPLALFAATVASVSVSLLNVSSIADSGHRTSLVVLSLVSGFAIPLFFGVGVARHSLDSARIGAVESRAALRFWQFAPAACFIACASLFWVLLQSTERRILIFGCQLAFVVHLFVAVAPFLHRGASTRENAFWQYNKALLISFATAGIFSGTAFVGMAIAFTAIAKLFDLNRLPNQLGHVFAFCAFALNTFVFLANLPARLVDCDDASDHPRVIRVFSLWILLPLVIAYVFILYAYLGKIIVSGIWPSNGVAVFICGVAALGQLCLLLLWPFLSRQRTSTPARLARLFSAALLPLVGLLFYAVGLRVHAYGLTEERLVPLILGGWVLCVIVAALAGRPLRLFYIPASLAVLSLVFTFGPMSLSSLSLRSQMSRFETQAKNLGLLSQGKLVARARPEVETPLSPDARRGYRELTSIAIYLVREHGPQALLGFLTPADRAAIETEIETEVGKNTALARDVLRPNPKFRGSEAGLLVGEVFEFFNFRFIDTNGSDPTERVHFHLGHAAPRGAFSVAGFTDAARVNAHSRRASTGKSSAKAHAVARGEMVLDEASGFVRVSFGEGVVENVDLRPFLSGLVARTSPGLTNRSMVLSLDEMQAEGTVRGRRYKFVFESIEIQFTRSVPDAEGAPRINSAAGLMFWDGR